MIGIYEEILRERKRLHRLSEEIERELSALPDGQLVYSHDGTRCKFYSKQGKERTYLSKEKQCLAERLARKRYLGLLLEDIKQEKRALEYYLRHHPKPPLKSSRFLIDLPECRELLSPYYRPISEELTKWMKESYEKNTKYPEHLIHKSISGNVVRSKSELLIDMMLYTNRIPYRYECALHLGDVTLYPDFTIRHPQTGELFYWEHFGLIDNASYCKSVSSKMQLYMSHGIIPTVNLIMTFETKEKAFTLETIEKIMKEFFLETEVQTLLA